MSGFPETSWLVGLLESMLSWSQAGVCRLRAAWNVTAATLRHAVLRHGRTPRRTISGVIDPRAFLSCALVASVALAGCGGAKKADVVKGTTTTAVSSTTAAAYKCPITTAQATTVLKATKPVTLISKARASCEYGTSLGEATADPDQPDAVVALLPVPIDAMQATAKRDHPKAKMKTRSDLGRETFQLIEDNVGGGKRVTIVGDAGAANGSWLVAVNMPKASDATAQALTRAEKLFEIVYRG